LLEKKNPENNATDAMGEKFGMSAKIIFEKAVAIIKIDTKIN
jgi:hypothetical protein